MKKALKFILIAGIIGGLVYGGLKILDIVTYDYLKVVDDSLTKYYSSASKADLEPATLLLDKYIEDYEKIEAIQERTNEVVDGWVTYVSTKYLCNNTNANACSVQLEELKILETKIGDLGNVESDEGEVLIASGDCDRQKDKVKAMIKTVDAIVKNKNSTSPKSDFEIEKEKCMKVVSTACENCSKTGVCSCNYIYPNGNKEVLTCYKPELAEK